MKQLTEFCFVRLCCVPQLAVQPLGAGQQALQEACAELAASMRENIRLRRGFLLTSPGVVGCYVHGAVAPGLGRIASLVALEGPTGPIDEVCWCGQAAWTTM